MSGDLVMTTSAHFKDGRLTCEWMLTGPLGMVLLRVNSFYAPERHPDWGDAMFRMVASDLGCHARSPMYEGQRLMHDDCHYLGGPCFYDGSSAQPADFMDDRQWRVSDADIESLLRDRYRRWLQEPHDERTPAGRSALDGGAR